MVQLTSERIDNFAWKIQNDYENDNRAYDAFISFARSRYRLSVDDAEDMWQKKMIDLTSENTKGNYGIDSFTGEIDKKTALFDDESLKNFLYRCISNECLSIIRKRDSKRKINEVQKYRGEDYRDSFFDSQGVDMNPLEALISDENGQRLKEGLNQLSSMDREILKLEYINELKYREIADKLNIPIGTVKSRLSSAKRRAAEIPGLQRLYHGDAA